jgi:hypothetical protein
LRANVEHIPIFDAVLRFFRGAEEFADAVRQRVELARETAGVALGVVEDADEGFVALCERPG